MPPTTPGAGCRGPRAAVRAPDRRLSDAQGRRRLRQLPRSPGNRQVFTEMAEAVDPAGAASPRAAPPLPTPGPDCPGCHAGG